MQVGMLPRAGIDADADAAATASPPQVLMATQGLSFGHLGQPLAPPVSFQVQRGEFWAVFGGNGCGKTTLLKTLLGLSPACTGAVHMATNLRLSYVPQKAYRSLHVPTRVRDYVLGGALRGCNFISFGRHKQQQVLARVAAHAQRLGVDHLFDEPLSWLSHGQAQRVAVVRALAGQPQCMLLDEPTSAVDVASEAQVLAHLAAEVAAEGLAVVYVGHHLKPLLQAASHWLFLPGAGAPVVAGPRAHVARAAAFVAQLGAQPDLLWGHALP